ncbi:hypothetical protein AYO41_04645 [Verrucomicrobia bacterium SCGC AG-212-E04]|nr:hypothetical protein AYO41_04645 [Verrucomicrobia bacterium SCGC AG-212-E04]
MASGSVALTLPFDTGRFAGFRTLGLEDLFFLGAGMLKSRYPGTYSTCSVFQDDDVFASGGDVKLVDLSEQSAALALERIDR